MITYPYIPNSAPQTKADMLRELGFESIEALFSAIPPELRLHRPLDLPAPLLSEFALRRHVESLLAKNTPASQALNFLGAGCYQHFVPAACDEINGRNEFLTAYSGKAYEEHGRWQALFEYSSLMAELLNMDVVSLPTYDGLQAAASAMRMAASITGRREIIVATSIQPDKFTKAREYNRHLALKPLDFEPATGKLNLSRLEELLSPQTAAVYFDNPNFFGIIETDGAMVAEMAHKAGALLIVGADPISLGVLKPPADYGADITCGDIQSLGIHMQFGGGHAGYIATHDDRRFIMEIPIRVVGFVPTRVEGEYGFGEVASERTSFSKREKGKEWVATTANLWAITAAVYLAVMGPQGMTEIGQGILQRGRYAMQRLAQVPGISAPHSAAGHFREFLVDFSGSGKTVSQVNHALLERGIFGGYDLGGKFPQFANHALYCVTEIHARADIDLLAQSLTEVLS